MKQFSEKDLDRSWSPEEVVRLSEPELTKLAFLRDFKNLRFFIPAGLVLYFIVGAFGILGKTLGWIGITMFGVFALQGLFNLALGLISLLRTPFLNEAARMNTAFWISLQLLISFVNFSIDIGLAFLIYIGMYDLDF